jgi:hypothetical protein
MEAIERADEPADSMWLHATARHGRPLPGRGTLLNTATVLIGASLGLLIGRFIPGAYQAIVMGGIGLVTLGIGVKMFLETRKVLVVVASIVLLCWVFSRGSRRSQLGRKSFSGREGQTPFPRPSSPRS